MISDQDRSYYIGASDTKWVMGNWNTKSFMDWWDTKLGLTENHMTNIYMMAGNVYEPLILDWMECPIRDRQIIIGRLRVNLDGETETSVIEAKTFGENIDWKPPKIYFQQVQVELFATDKKIGFLACYGLLDEDYASIDNPLPIDDNRMRIIPVQRDDDWLNNEYLPRLWTLAKGLEKGEIPCMPK